MLIFLNLVFSYVQKTCILTLVRNSCPMSVWTWYWLTFVLQGTLVKAWISWSSRRLRATFKILCKFFFEELFYSLRRLFRAHYCIPYYSAEYQQVSTCFMYLFSECWISSLHTNSTKRQRTRWMTKRWNTKKNPPSSTNNMMYLHESSRAEIFKRLYQDFFKKCGVFSSLPYYIDLDYL